MLTAVPCSCEGPLHHVLRYVHDHSAEHLHRRRCRTIPHCTKEVCAGLLRSSARGAVHLTQCFQNWENLITGMLESAVVERQRLHERAFLRRRLCAVLARRKIPLIVLDTMPHLSARTAAAGLPNIKLNLPKVVSASAASTMDVLGLMKSPRPQFDGAGASGAASPLGSPKSRSRHASEITSSISGVGRVKRLSRAIVRPHATPAQVKRRLLRVMLDARRRIFDASQEDQYAWPEQMFSAREQDEMQLILLAQVEPPSVDYDSDVSVEEDRGQDVGDVSDTGGAESDSESEEEEEVAPAGEEK